MTGAIAAVAGLAYPAIAERAPDGVELLEIQDGDDLSGVDFLVPVGGLKETLAQLPELRRVSVVQVLSAGTDWIEHLMPPQATLCSARGARDGPVSEWVLAALLGASSGLLECAPMHAWSKRELTDLAGSTVLIVGMGSIGALVGRRLKAMGVNVVGVASTRRPWIHGVDDLPDLLRNCDAIVLLTPLTESTRGLIGATELAALRDGALVVNAGRGPVLDTNALLAEVATGRLRAVLDVTDPEPLPDDHPLWDAPGVLSITPHVAGDSASGHRRAAELAGDQLARWFAGEELINVVRAGAG